MAASCVRGPYRWDSPVGRLESMFFIILTVAVVVSFACSLVLLTMSVIVCLCLSSYFCFTLATTFGEIKLIYRSYSKLAST